MATHEMSSNIINRVNMRARKMDNATGWATRHIRAFGTPKPGEAAVIGLIIALGAYADKHYIRYESTIGTDGVLGEGWSKIAKGILTLLDGELGALDAGTLDDMVREIMLSNNVDPDTGDLFYNVEETEAH